MKDAGKVGRGKQVFGGRERVGCDRVPSRVLESGFGSVGCRAENIGNSWSVLGERER